MPGYPWLRAAGTVGLATVVPFTGGWAAVAAITADHGGPSTTHSASGRVLAADSPNFAQQTASPAVVLNRSLSPSLEEVSRSAGRTPLEDHVGRMTTRVQVPTGPTAPSVKHRADSSDEPSPTAVVGGRHRAGTDQDPSTTSGRSGGGQPQSGGSQASGSDSGSASGSDSGSASGSDSGSASGSDSGQPQGSGSESGGSPASQDNGRHGEGGNAYGHDRAQSQGGNAYSQDGANNSGQGDSTQGGSSQDGAGHADSSQGSGNAYGHGNGEGQSASSGNGNGNGR